MGVANISQGCVYQDCFTNWGLEAALLHEFFMLHGDAYTVKVQDVHRFADTDFVALDFMRRGHRKGYRQALLAASVQPASVWDIRPVLGR